MQGKTRKRSSTSKLDSSNGVKSKMPKTGGIPCSSLFSLTSGEENLRVDKETVELVQDKYGTKFPQDFFQLFDFCRSLDAPTVKGSLSSAGLSLCGPYDLILNSSSKTVVDNTEWVTHCRFMHDPPEFTTLLCSTSSHSELHIGYVRDDPKELPLFVAMTDSKKGGKFFPLGPNIFSALLSFIEEFNLEDAEGLVSQLEKFSKKHDISLSKKSDEMKSRSKRVVAKTLNHLGLVVPVDADTEVGYRELPETDAKLMKMLDSIAHACDEDPTEKRRLELLEPVYEMVTLVQFANDEGDPGMGLELGLDLLATRSRLGCFDGLIETLLVTGYKLVKKDLYADIVAKHLACRHAYRDV